MLESNIIPNNENVKFFSELQWDSIKLAEHDYMIYKIRKQICKITSGMTHSIFEWAICDDAMYCIVCLILR